MKANEFDSGRIENDPIQFRSDAIVINSILAEQN